MMERKYIIKKLRKPKLSAIFKNRKPYLTLHPFGFYFLCTIVMKVLISCTENPKNFIKVLEELKVFFDKKVIFDEKIISAIRRLISEIV
jgi:hypothetical protein